MEKIDNIIARTSIPRERHDRAPTVSAALPHGGILEMVLGAHDATSAFAVWREGAWSLVPEVVLPDGRRLVPYSPHNNLLAHGVVRLPSIPEEYGTEAELVAEIRAFIHRYVNLSPLFEQIATYYVLLTWVHDAFNELPYLRVRGEPGTGKTRFLLTVGSVCYKPIFASGASTVSPLFRILDAMGGTLVIDESDFRVSDEKAEVVKILNNGNVRGFPVLRTEQVAGSKEFNPRAYNVFGPKIIATRGFFDDKALESRFISEQMSTDHLRDDIPISLPRAHEEEALHLRNRLLLFRFRNFGKTRMIEATDRTLEPRLSQVFSPLLAIVSDEAVRRDLLDLAHAYQNDLVTDRGLDLEARLIETVRDLWSVGEGGPSIQSIAQRLTETNGMEYPTLTPKRVGWILRRKLGFETVKSNGVYVLASGERPKLLRLALRYGVEVPDILGAPIQSP